MAAKSFVLILVVLCSFPAIVRSKCPCEDESLCKPIETPPTKEYFMFSTKPNVWRKYDWTKVTTIAIFRAWDDELMCEAHRRVSDKMCYYFSFIIVRNYSFKTRTKYYLFERIKSASQDYGV